MIYIQRGGQLLVRMRKGLASRAWESLVLAIVGEQFDVGNDICGAVVSVRYRQANAPQPRVPEESVHKHSYSHVGDQR